MTDDKTRIPFGTFGPQLDTLFQAVTNKVRLQWPTHLSSDGATLLLQGHVAVSHVTYKTVVHLCSDNPIRDGRRPEYALAATPLIRTILDALFNVVYLFDDFTSRKDQFYRGGWREIYEEHARLKAAHGSDPEWKEWLGEFGSFTESGVDLFGLTSSDVASVKQVPYWPTPGQMQKDKSIQPDRREFLMFLNDWFYRELSSDSHLSLPGLSRRAVPLLEGQLSFDSYRANCVFSASTLSVTLLSELQLAIQWPDLSPRLEYIWTILEEHWPAAGEVRRRRYKGEL